jgi:hypothetical protein
VYTFTHTHAHTHTHTYTCASSRAQTHTHTHTHTYAHVNVHTIARNADPQEKAGEVAEAALNAGSGIGGGADPFNPLEATPRAASKTHPSQQVSCDARWPELVTIQAHAGTLPSETYTHICVLFMFGREI